MTVDAPRPPRLLTRLLGLWRLGPRRRDVEEDLAELFHERAASRGPGYARRRYFVDVLSVGWRAARGEGRSMPRRSRLATGFSQDIVFATRLFRRQPAIVGMTIAGLALAISVTTAVFTMVHVVLFADTGIEEPGAVFRIVDAPWTFPDYQRLRESAQTLTPIATAWGSSWPEFRAAADADRGNLPSISVLPVTGNYFHVLGTRAALGRLLTPMDDEPGAPAAIVLSNAAWRTLLAGDPEIVGRTVWLGTDAYTVVGVVAHEFDPPENPQPQAWTSLAARFNRIREGRVTETRAAIAALRARGSLGASEADRLKVLEAALLTPSFPDQNRVFVRLRSHANRAQAEAEVHALATALLVSQGRAPVPNASVVQLRAITELDSGQRLILTLVTVPAALLVVPACANVMNLLLASAIHRRREFGTRLALGASRGRVVRQLLTESVLLGAVAGVAGLLLASWLVPWLASRLSAAPESASPSLAVYAAATLFTLIAAVVTGLVPARLGWRSDVTVLVKSDRVGSPTGSGGGRLRAVLVGAQAAASVVLLIISALLIRSLLHVATYDHGADIDQLLNVEVRFVNADDARCESLLHAALDRISAMPGIAGVSRVTFPPFFGGGATDTAGRNTPRRRSVHRNFVSSSYFATVGAKVLEGRVFTDEEVRVGAPVAVITSVLAREFWPGESPVGSDLHRVWGADDGTDGSRDSWNRKPAGTRIVGVVEETTATSSLLGRPTLYLPISAAEARELFVIRVSPERNPEDLITPVQEALRALDPAMSRTIDSMASLYREELEPRKFWAQLASAVGLAALALALVGLFGVTAYAVAQRRHEVSVRLALGATGHQAIALLLRGSLRPVVIGIFCGLGLSLLLDRLVRGLLIGVQPRDPLAMILAVAILLSAAALAAFLPARHAARVDPAEMLKQS